MQIEPVNYAGRFFASKLALLFANIAPTSAGSRDCNAPMVLHA